VQFISIIQMTHFHAIVKLVRLPFNKDPVLILKFYVLHCIKVIQRISE